MIISTIPITTWELSVLSISSDSEQEMVAPSRLPAKSVKQFVGKAQKHWQKPKLKYIYEEDSDDRAFIDDSAIEKESPEQRLVS